MKTAHIGLQRGGGLMGWMVRLVTRSRFGHALIRFDDVCFSADVKNGWGWLRTNALKSPTTWYALEVTDEQWDRMMAWCLHRVGWEYDKRSVLKFTTLYRLFLPSREAQADRGKMFCSEGVYLSVLEGAGIALLGEAQAWEVAPGHFRFSNRLKREVML